MPNFTEPSKFNASANFSSVKFGADSRLLEVELNELQDIAKEKNRAFIAKHIGDGIYGDGTMVYSGGNFTIANEFAIINGNLLTITTLTLAAAEGQSVYLDVWEQEVQGSYTIKQYGNQQTAITVPNNIIDARMAQETTRRYQTAFTLSLTNVTSGHQYHKLGTITGGVLVKNARLLNSNVIGNVGGVPSFQLGTEANLPTPTSDLSKIGRIYITSDTGKILQDTGSAWATRGGSTTIQENFTTQIQTEIDAKETKMTGTKKADALCWGGQCIYATTSTGTVQLASIAVNNLKFGDYTLIVRVRCANITATADTIQVKVQRNDASVWSDIGTTNFKPTVFTSTTAYRNVYIPFVYTGAKATNNQLRVIINLLAPGVTAFEVAVDFIDIIHSTINVYN